MLSDYGRRERIWGPFPALRQVLETAPESTRHAVPTSVSEDVFERIRRLVVLANIAEEHKEALLEAARREPMRFGAQMADDLEHVGGELDYLRRAFDEEIDNMKALRHELFKVLDRRDRG